eukprot:2466357-Pyramimonas_sp.AAC.1
MLQPRSSGWEGAWCTLHARSAACAHRSVSVLSRTSRRAHAGRDRVYPGKSVKATDLGSRRKAAQH